MTLWWVFQICYAISVVVWLTGAVLLLREFFREYDGKIYDYGQLSTHAGIPDHGPVEVIEHSEFQAWKTERFRHIKRASGVFLAGTALFTLLHLTQAYFLPHFEIPFYSDPTPQQTGPDAGDQTP